MKNKYSKVLHNYFSDYRTWLLSISVLFVVATVVTMAFNGMNQFLWILPVAFLAIYLMSMPLLLLYCKVRKDIKENNIEKQIIRILEIQCDHRFNFENKGGATIGKTKYRLVDEEHNVYLLSASNDRDMFIASHSCPDFSLEVEVLKKSRLVLHMKIVESADTGKKVCKQQNNIVKFKKIFGHYF